LKVGLGAVLLVLFLLGGTTYYIYRSLQPTAAGEAKQVLIPAGTGSAGIARILEQEGIIRNHTVFTLYLKAIKEGSRFQAGTYELIPGMLHKDLIQKLNKGETIKEEVLRFTIPEGFTVLQIADKLSQEAGLSRETFLKLAKEGKDWSSSWAAAIPPDKPYKFRLEGYLFPETYEMKKDSTEKDIVERMLGELERKLSQLPADWKDRMAERKLTFHQLLTIASLIEREVAAAEERELVAGVIYNRLNRSMPLQIDATVQYLFDKPKDRVLEKDLQIESPYNTYLHSGLPPGPIASPSLASIEAALYPVETKYLFYVTKKDGSQKHLFAETFEEHKKNIAKSKAGE